MSGRPQPKFHGVAQKGRLVLDRRDDFAALIQKLDGCQIDITLCKHRAPRSLSQNGYYWAVVVPLLAEHCGYEREEMHEALKMKFLLVHGESAFPTLRSTTELDTAEFTEYIEQCRRLAAGYGVVIPDPGEVA